MENNKRSGIYSITNTINNKRYIGLSSNLEKRLNEHYRMLDYKTHSNIKLQKSVNKHGLNNFIFEILEIVECENLSSREVYWINYYDSVKNGYNILLGGKDEYLKKSMGMKLGFPPMVIIKYVYSNLFGSADFYCEIVFGIGIEELILKDNKTYKEKVAVKAYLSRKEKLEDLLSGNFEKYKDKRSLNGLINYEAVFIEKQYTKMVHDYSDWFKKSWDLMRKK